MANVLNQVQYLKRYGIAIATVLIAFLLMLALDPALQLARVPSLLFLGAITVSAFYGGRNSGVAATLLSAVLINYFLVSPSGLVLSLSGGLRLALFVLEGVLISVLVGSLHTAQARLRQNIHQLKATEADVRDLNQALQRQVGELQALAAAKFDSEDRYHILTESIDEGFCICELLLNEDGAPVDYRFLEINPVFETLTGLQQPVGRTARELVPDLEEVWFETYGRVALNREPIRFEQQSVPLQRWFDVYAFPVGEPQRHLFGLLFRDITARKAIEQEREQFLAVSSDLQVITGRNGYFQWVNPTFEHVLGWTAAEATARPWTEFVHPDDMYPSILEKDSLFSGHETSAFENRYRHKDGSYRWLRWKAQSDRNQQVIYGAAVDITKSKRREANAAFLAEIATEFSRLSSADETMQTIGAKIGAYLNLSICAFADIDDAEEEAVIHYAWHAQGAPNVVGSYRLADFVTDDFRRAVHNRETVVIQDTDADPRTDGKQYAALNIHSFVSVPFYKDGQWKFLLNVYDSAPRNWRDDEIELIRELANQIFPRLKRARAEAALRESEARFKGFAENSNDVVWITDADEYRLVYVSPSFEQIWGRSATELHTDLDHFIDFIHPDDRDRIQWGWQQCTQAAFTQEYRIIRPDGTLVWIRDRGFPIYDDQGELLWIGGIAEDISDRKRVEETLQQRETELRLVTNAVPSLISFVDAEQCYRFNNHTYEEWFGQPAAATYGKHLRDVLGEAAYERIRPYVEQVLAGQQVSYENELPYKEGGTRFVNATYVPRFNSEGVVEGFVALVNDVSDRKQAENELRESERRFRRLVESNMFGVAFGNFSGEIHYVNNYFLDMIGYTREELEAGQVKWTEITPPEFLHLDEYAIEELKISGAATPFEKEYIRKDGSRVPILIGAVLLQEPYDQHQEMIGFYLDLTERNQAENAILELNQQLQAKVNELQTLLNVIPIGIGIAEDRECRYIRANPAFARLLNVPSIINTSLTAPQEERPTTFKVYQNGQEMAPEELPLQHAAAHGVEVHESELEIVRQDGIVLSLVGYAAPLFDESGQPRGSVGAFLDITTRKQAETALREKEQQLQQLSDSMPQFVWVCNAQGELEYVNLKWVEYSGLTIEQSQNHQKIADVYHPDDKQNAFNQWAIALETKQEFEIEARLRRALDQTYRWFLIRAIPQFDEREQVVRWIGTSTDIHDSKLDQLNEQFLKELDFQLRQFSSVEAMQWEVVSRLGQYLDVDRSVWDHVDAIAGVVTVKQDWRKQELPGIAGSYQLSDFILPELIDLFLAGQPVVVPNVARYPYTAPFADNFRALNASAFISIPCLSQGRWIATLTLSSQTVRQWRLDEVKLLQETVARLWATIEQARAVQALHESEERLRLALIASNQGLFDLNIKTGETVVSPEYSEMLGYDPDQLQETNAKWRDRLHPDDEATVYQAYEDYITGKVDIYQVEFRQRTQSGDWQWILSVGKIVSWDEAGQPLRMLGTHTNITKRKQAEAILEQLLVREQTARETAEAANRIKDEFLAVVSHELRSPLNPILGWARLLQTRQLDEQKTKTALDVIARNAQTQAQLINDLLDVSRILRGKLSLNTTQVNLVTTIESAVETVRLAAEAKSIQLNTTLDPDVGQVSGDPDRLQQVVWNLLSNAVKFTPQGGRVEVRLERGNGGALVRESVDALEREGVGALEQGSGSAYAQITITDTGKGIHPDFLPYVFERFRQEDAATTRQFGGLGLGLALVRYLVELHGGTVQVESPGEGQGATFTVKLPLLTPYQPTPGREAEPFKPTLDLSNIRVLIVDDDPHTREFISFLIELHGADVMAVASADEAIAVLPQFTPDILLSDIGMPDRDGYMLMRQVRDLPPEQGGQIPAIALTAYAGEIDYRQAMAAGFQKHISKPVEPEQLIAAIAELVKGGR